MGLEFILRIDSGFNFDGTGNCGSIVVFFSGFSMFYVYLLSC